MPTEPPRAPSTIFAVNYTRRRSCLLLTAFVLLPLASSVLAQSTVSPALPVIPAGNFKITDFGAIGDNEATNTAAIQAAINAAITNGGGTVEVPAGQYLSGPFRFASQINLHLDEGAVLRMLPIDKYPGTGTFITGNNLHDIALSGPGAIDGQGSPWWPRAKNGGGGRPSMIAFSRCTRVLVEQVTLSNSPMFMMHISGGSTDATVRKITVRAPASTDPVNPSHNTDACDVGGRNFLIQDCDISVGDDDFTCSGNTFDVLITNCTYGYGHGVSIGSFTQGGVSNMTIINCTFNNTEAGIRIKSDRGRGGYVHDLKYINLHMTNVLYPVLIYGSYNAQDPAYRALTDVSPAIAGKYPGAALNFTTPIYGDMIFSNITATVAPGHRAGLIWGLPEAAVTNVLFQNVTITADKPFGIYDATDIKFVDCKIITPDGVNKLSTTNAQVTITPP